MHKHFIPKWVADLGLAEIDRLIAAGKLRLHGDTIIPVLSGGTDDEPLFAAVPRTAEGEIDTAALAALPADQLSALVTSYEQALADVTADPSQFVTAEFTVADLLDETRAAYATLRALRAAQTPEEPVELSDADIAAFADLAAEHDPGDEQPEEVDEVEEVEEPEIVAAAPPAPARRRRMPSTSGRELAERNPAPAETVALTAAAGAPDMSPGDTFGSDVEIAQAMIRRHSKFGSTGPGTVEQFSIAKADWTEAYGPERRLTPDIEGNFEVIRDVTRPQNILTAFDARRKAAMNGQAEALTASGGLCAPVTPYYNLQMLSVPTRPVMGALPSFNADRGGLRYATPASLAAITTAVGLITAEEDEVLSTATKSCQVIDCPPFQETDVDIIYHCLQFGNLGARTFPELVAQWNNLVLAAHARLAESNLLTGIDAFSTQVTAGSLGLGASASLFSQILAAADGMRSRNRMNPEAVLRIMLPWWAVDLIVSDVIRTQFQRFDTDRARVIALLRSFNIEPTFYIDSANGRGQVFGTQGDNDPLLSFPDTVVWYLYPEGSFLYLDGGTLELGIVRDSVLNATNDFQIFGESFENVAYVGVESLAVVSHVCDSGAVSAPVEPPTCPIDYAIT